MIPRLCLIATSFLGIDGALGQIIPEPGWPVSTTYSVSPSATTVQLDADPQWEVVIASQDEYIYAYNHDGTLCPGWPQWLGDTLYPDEWLRFNSSPAAADIDDDGWPEIIVGGLSGKLWAYNHDGTVVPGFPLDTGYMIGSTPAIGDIDGDGELEIVIGNHYGRIYALKPDGTVCPGFPYTTAYAIRGSPALGDLDGDGHPEIVCPSEASGYDLFALNGNGQPLPGWPRDLMPGLGIHSSPALGDINQDGSLDIVIGLRNGNLLALNADGSPLPGWPYNPGYTIESSPALVNLDGDPQLEIVVGANNSRIVALNHDGTLLPGWPVSTTYSVLSSPSVGDIDGDGALEIVVGENTGKVYGLETSGAPVAGFPLLATYTIYSSPLLADLDLDGHLELLVGSNDIRVYCWDLGPGTYDPYRLPWPQFRRDARNTASVAPQRGDLNCDGAVNAFDIDPFVLALGDPTAYLAAHEDCDLQNADANGDGAVNSFDIDPFVELLTGP